jgi:hypothetical protein
MEGLNSTPNEYQQTEKWTDKIYTYHRHASMNVFPEQAKGLLLLRLANAQ